MSPTTAPYYSLCFSKVATHNHPFTFLKIFFQKWLHKNTLYYLLLIISIVVTWITRYYSLFPQKVVTHHTPYYFLSYTKLVTYNHMLLLSLYSLQNVVTYNHSLLICIILTCGLPQSPVIICYPLKSSHPKPPLINLYPLHKWSTNYHPKITYYLSTSDHTYPPLNNVYPHLKLSQITILN